MTKQDWTVYLSQKLKIALRKNKLAGFWLWFTRTQSRRRG